MPQYLSNDPNAVDSKQGGGGSKYLSTDPNGVDSKTNGSNHPMLAAITRLLGGVGSAIASPADITAIGSTIPAGIAGGSEALAEWLEGSELSPGRIATEAAIGAVPFAKMVKEGRVLANMGKAGVLGAVGEGAREKARGEDLSLGGIAGSGALNALTYGAFAKFMGHGKGVSAAPPSGPKMTESPIISQEPGNKVFRMPPDWESKVTGAKPKPPTQPPSVGGQHNFANEVRGGVSKAIGRETDASDALKDLDKGIQDATRTGSQHRAANFRAENQSLNRENAANLEDIKKLLAIKKAEELTAQRAGSGLEPSTTFSESESGIDETGRRISKNTKFTPPNEDGPGGDVPNGNPENPIDALMRKLGMGQRVPAQDDLSVNPHPDAPFGGAKFDDLTPSNVDETGWVPPPVKDPDVPFSIFHAGKTGSGWNELNPGPPREGAPWGGAAIPNLEQYLLNTAEGRVAAGNRVNVEPVTSAPPSPVSKIAQVLRPRRSLKTPEGFNAAVERNLAGVNQPPSPAENVVPGASGSPGEPIGGLGSKPDISKWDSTQLQGAIDSLESKGLTQTPRGITLDELKAARDNAISQLKMPGEVVARGVRTETPRAPLEIVPKTTGGEPNGSPPESALAKFFKTKQGATGANYRAAKDAAKAGEIPTADYARDSHLIQLGKEPEGPLAGGAQPSVIDWVNKERAKVGLPPLDLAAAGQRIDERIANAKARVATEGSTDAAPDWKNQVPPVEGGTVETPTPSTTDPNAPDWVKQELERLERLKALNSEVPKDPNERGAIAPGLMRLLTAGTGAAIGAPVGSYLDPDDPNASTKGALAGGALGYAGSKGVQELINWRNAGLLATPSAQLKKPLSDLGAYIGKAGESALSGKFQSETVPLMREMFNPVNIRNYGRAFKNPRLAEDVIGDTAKPYIEPAKGLMGLVARPFAGAQYATSQAMQRAGISPEEAKDILFLGQPKTEILQKWLNLQKTPGWGGQVVRAMRPFARISTNLFERGWQRIPGISMMTGDPETRMARTILGTGAMAAGAMTGHSDQEALDQGGYEVSPIVRGLRRALLASYGIPFMAGEALAGPAGMRDLAYMIPGSTQNIPMPGPKDTAGSWGQKIGKRWLDQMMPDWLAPQDWEAKPQR